MRPILKINLALDSEIVNWPTKIGNYKVIQLEFGDQKIIRLGDEWKLHGEILKQYLQYFRINYKTFLGESGLAIPVLEGEGYKAVGMGYVLADPIHKSAFFSQSSIDYNIGINEDHLRDVSKIYPEWTFDWPA